MSVSLRNSSSRRRLVSPQVTDTAPGSFIGYSRTLKKGQCVSRRYRKERAKGTSDAHFLGRVRRDRPRLGERIALRCALLRLGARKGRRGGTAAAARALLVLDPVVGAVLTEAGRLDLRRTEAARARLLVSVVIGRAGRSRRTTASAGADPARPSCPWPSSQTHASRRRGRARQPGACACRTCACWRPPCAICVASRSQQGDIKRPSE